VKGVQKAPLSQHSFTSLALTWNPVEPALYHNPALLGRPTPHYVTRRAVAQCRGGDALRLPRPSPSGRRQAAASHRGCDGRHSCSVRGGGSEWLAIHGLLMGVPHGDHLRHLGHTRAAVRPQRCVCALTSAVGGCHATPHCRRVARRRWRRRRRRRRWRWRASGGGEAAAGRARRQRSRAAP
jgi:hypothetical protein